MNRPSVNDSCVAGFDSSPGQRQSVGDATAHFSQATKHLSGSGEAQELYRAKTGSIKSPVCSPTSNVPRKSSVPETLEEENEFLGTSVS